MKQMKKLSALAAGSIVIGLLLGTSMAQAAEVCLDGNTVTRIENLEVFGEGSDVQVYDVDFRFETGLDVYGQNLDDFPFTDANREEDALLVMRAINNALQGNSPVPGSAGVSSQNIYFIGVDRESENSLSLIAAVGGEYRANAVWEVCGAPDCITGAAVLGADVQYTWADLTPADADDSCDGGSSFSITPGITGSWYDPARDGEGYNIEIIGSSLEPQMLAYFYTYDDTGNQMWLVGTGSVSGDTATVPMQVTSGAVFGPGFDPADVIREDWGTVTFIFSSCDAGTATYNSTMGFGSGTSNIERVSSVTGLSCP